MANPAGFRRLPRSPRAPTPHILTRFNYFRPHSAPTAWRLGSDQAAANSKVDLGSCGQLHRTVHSSRAEAREARGANFMYGRNARRELGARRRREPRGGGSLPRLSQPCQCQAAALKRRSSPRQKDPSTWPGKAPTTDHGITLPPARPHGSKCCTKLRTRNMSAIAEQPALPSSDQRTRSLSTRPDSTIAQAWSEGRGRLCELSQAVQLRSAATNRWMGGWGPARPF